ncbi:MAG: trypsin-like peptidase domain-containing protein [Acidimicrobiia bacterium]|nr:trypsin-like peptidase domain-containing protein [Acidimicrobiia bacterium]
MTTENPPTPGEPGRWPYTQPDETEQAALPIPEAGPMDRILYPSDPTGYPSPSDPIAPVSRPELPFASAQPHFLPPVGPSETPTAPTLLDEQPAASGPESKRARSGVGRGVLLGLLLGAVIGASAFGLGRLTAPDGETSASSLVEVTVPSTSLVANTTPPPIATIPQSPGSVEPVVAAAAIVTPAVVQLNTTLGTGSGVIYSADGYILTAAHVVGDATSVSVRFADGSRTTGTVVGADDTTDVAVVMIEPAEVPAVAVLGTGLDLSVGQTAVAVGSPFELDQTVTSGIISAVDRIVGADRISMVQTDAAINPGNSGGPLVDLNGRVLGINDVIFTNSGDNAGVGFAISIDLAKIVADQITAGEPVSTALLGVSVGASTEGDAGGLVSEVSPGSAADLAGIEVGDLIISFDGDPLRGPSELRAEVITRAPGTEVDIVVIRGGEQLTLRVVLGSAGG